MEKIGCLLPQIAAQVFPDPGIVVLPAERIAAGRQVEVEPSHRQAIVGLIRKSQAVPRGVNRLDTDHTHVVPPRPEPGSGTIGPQLGPTGVARWEVVDADQYLHCASLRAQAQRVAAIRRRNAISPRSRPPHANRANR